MNDVTSSAPVIGISGGDAYSKSILAMISIVEAARATIKLLNNHGNRSPQKDFEEMDAIIFMGNDLDIDPASYIERYPEGHPKRCFHPETRNERSTPEGCARADYEEALMQIALEKRMPIFGICGGMQRLNVLCGGTLHQHVPDMVGHDRLNQTKHGLEPHLPIRPIVIPDGTRLAMIARNVKMAFIQSKESCSNVIMENSIRHQSIDILGEGLRVCSLSDTIRRPDGTADYLIEAIEADPAGPYHNQFLLGVQWHPEFGASPLGEHIIRHFVKAAEEFASNKK